MQKVFVKIFKKIRRISWLVCSKQYLLADVSENFQNMWTWSWSFFSASGLAWQSALNKTKVKLDVLSDIDMLLLTETCNRGGICHSVCRYTKANNKYIKNYDKNKEF